MCAHGRAAAQVTCDSTWAETSWTWDVYGRFTSFAVGASNQPLCLFVNLNNPTTLSTALLVGKCSTTTYLNRFMVL